MSQRIYLIRSLLYTLYFVLTIIVFGAYNILDVDINLYGYYSIVFTVTFLSQFLSVNFLNKKLKHGEEVAFFISSLTVLLLSLILIDDLIKDIYIEAFAMFFVPPILPALFLILQKVFNTNQSHSVITNEYEETLMVENQDILENQIKEDDLEKRFVLESENGKILIDLDIARIICFEASDNYAVTYYLNQNDDVKKSMERVSLKKIESILEDLNTSNFERIHKSYIINKTFVNELKGKAQAYKIKMEKLNILIPVSRSYDINIIKKLID